MSLQRHRTHRNPWLFRALIACLTASVGAGLGGCASLGQQRTGASARGDDAASWRMKASRGQWTVGNDARADADHGARADHSAGDARADQDAAQVAAPSEQPAAQRTRHARTSSWDWRWGKHHGRRAAHHAPARNEVASARPARAAAPEPAPEPEPEPSMGDDDITDLVAADDHGGAQAPPGGGTMDMAAMQFGSPAPAPADEPAAAPVKIHHHSKRWCRHHRRRCRAERRRERLAARALRRKQQRDRAEALAAADSPVPTEARQPIHERPRAVAARSPRPAARRVRGEFDENGEGFLDESEADGSPTRHHPAASHGRAPAPAPQHQTVARTSPPPRHHQFVDDHEGFIDDSVGHLPSVKTDHRGQVIDNEDPLK